MPLSTDYAAAVMFVRNATPELISQQGTAIPQAIALAEKSFSPEPGAAPFVSVGVNSATAFGTRNQVTGAYAYRDAVLARYGAVAGEPSSTAVQQQIWALSEAVLPEQRLADYTQALMDLGATVCTRKRPACERCCGAVPRSEVRNRTPV